VAAFPAYAALADPRPLSVAETQTLLKPDEALVAILVGSAKSFLWVVTRERTVWAQIDFGNEEMAKEVLALRNGLDPLAQQDAEGATGSRAGVVQGFALFGAAPEHKRVAALEPHHDLPGARHETALPTGPLTSLPFRVLITRPPRAGGAARCGMAHSRICAERAAVSALVECLAQPRWRRKRLAAILRRRRPCWRGTAERQRSGRKRQAATPAGSIAMALPISGPCVSSPHCPDTAEGCAP
jgi:hypothetical protein